MCSAKLLLTTVFKPFAVNDKFSRVENIPELMMSQITRVQGIFCYRAWHANAGLHLIAANCGAETTILEWPSLDEFIKEITENAYSHIGISFIPSTFEKMREMVSVVRKKSPRSKIIIGGHGVMIPHIERIVDVEYVCEGDGIRFVRNMLGMSPVFSFHHPVIKSVITEFMGVPMPIMQTGEIVTGLGCQNGCEFCVTSAFFNCQYQPFLNNGRDVYQLLKKQHAEAHIKSFWIIDENFLRESVRTQEFLEAVILDGSEIPDITIDMMWSTAELVKSYHPSVLAQLGISKVWMGYESMNAHYGKNRGVDFKKLVADLAEYGISVLLSCTAFDDLHNEQSWQDEVDKFIDLGQAYSQFLPLTAFPGTPLFDKMEKENRLLHAIPYEEVHALTESNTIHPTIPRWMQSNLIESAYLKDYEKNGPSQLRDLRIRAQGCLTMMDSDDSVLRKRASYIESQLNRQIPWIIAAQKFVEYQSHGVEIEKVIELTQKINKNMGIIEENNSIAKNIEYIIKKSIAQKKNESIIREPGLRKTVYNGHCEYCGKEEVPKNW